MCIRDSYQGEYITDKARIQQILPDIDTEHILGAGYTKDDGYFDGTMISNTYARKLKENGGKILTMTKVIELLKENGKVIGLKTEDGTSYALSLIHIWPS